MHKAGMLGLIGPVAIAIGCRGGESVEVEHLAEPPQRTPLIATEDLYEIGAAILDDGSGGGAKVVALPPVTRVFAPPPATVKPQRGASLPTISSTNAVVALAAKQAFGSLLPLTIILDELPSDWRAFRQGDRTTKNAFIQNRSAAILKYQAPLLAWLSAKNAKNTHSSWLANVVDTEVPVEYVDELAKRSDVIGLSPKSNSTKGLRAWAGKESQDATRMANFAAASLKGHRGSRLGGPWSQGGRIRIGIIEAIQPSYPNWPLTQHPSWKRTEPGGATRLFVRDCSSASCSPTAASQSTDGATHGTLVSWIASGSVEHSQDGSYLGTHTDDQRLRSGHLHDAYIFYYMENGAGTNGDAWAIDKAVAEGVDVINISSSLAAECNPNANVSGINERIRNATNAGVVVVAAAGNLGSGASCTIAYPADRPEVIAVNGLKSDSETSSYDSLLIDPNSCSRGGMPIGLYGGGSSTIAGIDLVAPSKFTYYPSRSSIVSPPLLTYASPGNSTTGSSMASPVIAAAAGAVRNAFEVSGFDMTDSRLVMANLLVMGDGWNADSGGISPVFMNTLSGGGRFRGHFPSSQDLQAPAAWGWRAVPIRQGEHVYWPIGTPPLSPQITMWKGAVLWTPADLNAVPDIDFYIENTCPFETIASDISYDIRARFRVTAPNLAGKCLQVHAYGFNVPPGGTTFYAADYFHSGPTNVH